MNWILIALLAPLLFSISVFIDRFLVSRYFKSSSGTLVVYTGLIGLPVFLLILLFKPEVIGIDPVSALLITVNSFLVIGYLFPYYASIKMTDASAVVPLFQMIPVFNFILAFLVLKETLSPMQIGAASLIILGALGISLSLKRKVRLNKKVLGLMLIATLLISINATVFKYFALDLDFWTVSFWQYLGFFVFAMLLLVFSAKFRHDFVDSFRKNKKAIISLNAINETINLTATIIFTYAALQAPLALVSAINGLGSVFVFLIGILLTLFLPKMIKEDLSLRTIIQKAIFIILIFIGGYLLNSTF
ncbi:MAG TPA: DMT family transporter [Candidatus Nanoarchaeia archaeon]|nr:DMT family transporter [Candidatus Nanoarchaeia archaeon]